LCAVIVAAAATIAADAPGDDTSRNAYRDLQLMVHARKALREQETLAALNVGVRVHDGIATLFGPVPSADVIPKALKSVDSIQGILGVRSELYVAVREKEPDALVIPQPAPEPTVRQSASPDPIYGLLGELTARGGKNPAAARVASPGAAPAGTEASRPEGVVRPDIAPGKPPLATQAPATAVPLEDLKAALERTQLRDARFRTLRFEVRGALVIISGAADRDEDIMAFARTISRLPGVERVLTKTDPVPAP
jgi:osmotically-inducible protein OsmY